MQGVFITGTGTDVGKTFIGAEIARQLTQRNITVIPRKPIESGCLNQGGKLTPQDASALKLAANYQGDLTEVCPHRFEPPISPVRAANLANKIVTTEQLVNICLRGSELGYTLVEGAGGFYSPIAENGLNADLAVALQLPILLIADDQLGALNHVLLNTEAILRRGLQLIGVVLNARNNNNDEHMDNAADLREYIDCPIFSSPFQQGNHKNSTQDITAKLPKTLIDTLASTTTHIASRIKAVK